MCISTFFNSCFKDLGSPQNGLKCREKTLVPVLLFLLFMICIGRCEAVLQQCAIIIMMRRLQWNCTQAKWLRFFSPLLYSWLQRRWPQNWPFGRMLLRFSGIFFGLELWSRIFSSIFDLISSRMHGTNQLVRGSSSLASHRVVEHSGKSFAIEKISERSAQVELDHEVSRGMITNAAWIKDSWLLHLQPTENPNDECC